MIGLLTALGPFGLGLLNMVNPCVLPLYPGFLAYLAGSQSSDDSRRGVRWFGIVVLAGVLTSMLLLGFIVALLQVALGSILAVVLPVIYLLVVGMGLLLFLDINLLARLPAIRTRRVQNPLFSCFLYGLLYGPMTLPCSGPLIVGVFAYSTADVRSLVDGLIYVVAFGLGFGLPLVIFPLLTEATRKFVLQKMLTHHHLLMRGAGVVLILIGLLGFVKDWALIRNYWGF